MKLSFRNKCIYAGGVMIMLTAAWIMPVFAGSVDPGLGYAAQIGLSGQDPRVMVARIIQVALGFLGLLAVVLVIYAGYLWMTSKGDEEKITRAKTILKNGVIGLAIILSSFAIVTFILGRLMGALGDPGSGGEDPGGGSGLGGLGNGIIKSVYPEPFQTDVPRNTSIMVTFRVPIAAASICDAVTAESPPKCAPGARIRSNSVQIYQTSQTPVFVTDVAAASSDNLTFVFRPAPPYLGSVSGDTDYTVRLTNDIKTAGNEGAFGGLAEFRWSFTVGNFLDLEPPRILNLNQNGLFPLPDNGADAAKSIVGAQAARGSIAVSGLPYAYRAASAAIAKTNPQSPNASIQGTNTCADGFADIVIAPAGTVAYVAYSDEGLVSGDVSIINNQVNLVPCGLTAALGAGFQAGHSWRVSFLAERQADTLTVGGTMYTFVESEPGERRVLVGGTNQATAANVVAAINAIHPQVTAALNQASVIVTAKVAGVGGNSIELSSTSPVLQASRMIGGTDQYVVYDIVDKEDQPMNTVIQINFNEAINPLTVAGSSLELYDKLRVLNGDAKALPEGAACTAHKECRSFKCSNGTCEGNALAGTFMISNQYRTVEFISDNKCGVNGCGESIYCLPANSHIRVEAVAASLTPCSGAGDCTMSPFSQCTNGVCHDAGSGKNYPQAGAFDGILDAADNSFDGNRNENAEGKDSFWSENNTPDANKDKGDNHQWAFWVGDKLDLTPPRIESTSVPNNQSNVNLSNPIEITFNKLMMSATMTTGITVIDNGLEEVTHRLINLWSLGTDLVGYWVGKTDIDTPPLDGRPDKTKAILSHGFFRDSTAYKSQVGSGVKDLYQNCYKPSAGPDCNANAANPSCCRNAAGQLVPTAILSADGNCLN